MAWSGRNFETHPNAATFFRLIGGLEHVLFSISYIYIYGMSSFPLTNSIIFQDGRSPTKQRCFVSWYFDDRDQALEPGAPGNLAIQKDPKRMEAESKSTHKRIHQLWLGLIHWRYIYIQHITWNKNITWYIYIQQLKWFISYGSKHRS